MVSYLFRLKMFWLVTYAFKSFKFSEWFLKVMCERLRGQIILEVQLYLCTFDFCIFELSLVWLTTVHKSLVETCSSSASHQNFSSYITLQNTLFKSGFISEFFLLIRMTTCCLGLLVLMLHINNYCFLQPTEDKNSSAYRFHVFFIHWKSRTQL